MTGRDKDAVINGETHEARLEAWIDSVGNIVLPLLAAFSITAVVIVSDDAGNFSGQARRYLPYPVPRWRSLWLSNAHTMRASTFRVKDLTTRRESVGLGGHGGFTVLAFFHCY